MSNILKERVSAHVEGGFVVFLIGMRINTLWKVSAWLPVVQAMARMQIELAKRPELGLLHLRNHFGLRNIMTVQYWRSFDHLEAFARGDGLSHLPAWQAFSRNLARAGDVGIWHETFMVSPGQYESVYHNMPRHGLGQAGDLRPATGSWQTAQARLQAARDTSTSA